MKRFAHLATVLAALALFFLCCPPRAHAYLDLGTGSLLLQVLIAFFLGAGVAIKLFWKNIRAFVLGILGRHPAVEEEAAAVGQGGPEGAAPPNPEGHEPDDPTATTGRAAP